MMIYVLSHYDTTDRFVFLLFSNFRPNQQTDQNPTYTIAGDLMRCDRSRTDYGSLESTKVSFRTEVASDGG
jgi:hypothetical protein